MGFSVDFSEEHGWPRSRWVNGEFVAERKLRCAWGDRITLFKELNYTENLVYPVEYGEGPADALVTEIAMQGDSGGAQLSSTGHIASYLDAFLTVQYSTGGPIIVGNEVISEQLVPSTEYKIVDTSKLRWGSENTNNLVFEAPPRKQVAIFDYVLTYHRTTGVGNDINSPAYVNHVNLIPVGTFGLNLSFASETALYRGASVRRSYTSRGWQTFRVAYKWSIKPSGWNNEWRIETALFEPIYVAGVGVYKNFPLTTFPFP